MKLSIITINFNNRDGLRKTIESVVNQTWQEFEYIVIDGGSTDGSVEVIKEFADRIDYWVSEPDKGIYNALNKGVAVAQGEYCNFMNSGDCLYDSDTLEKVFATLPTADIVCGNTYSSYLKVPPQEITFEFLFNESICHQCAFIRTTLMKKHGYDEKYKIVADRKFFVQALLHDNCSYQAVDVNVVKYDITGFSAANPVQSRLEYAQVLEELVPERIRLDYGRQSQGELYGDTDYDKLFIEIRKRNYRKLIYTLVVGLLRIIAVFVKSASFIKKFPLKLDK
jgi:glycosyltransferase involved in cell wall biosynthesis